VTNYYQGNTPEGIIKASALRKQKDAKNQTLEDRRDGGPQLSALTVKNSNSCYP